LKNYCCGLWHSPEGMPRRRAWMTWAQRLY
jgi:hypothetical protein